MKLNHYLIYLIKANIQYFVLLVIILISMIVSVVIFYSSQNYYKNKIQAITSDINELETKQKFIEYKNKIANEGIDIDNLSQLMAQLVPDKEDYFSIIAALDSISQKTSFVITSYSLGIDKTASADRLSLAVTGTGNQDAFLNFLKNYNFIGGRLITIDKIQYDSQGATTIVLSSMFYSGKAPSNSAFLSTSLSGADKQLLSQIQSKVTLSLISSNNADTNVVSYPTKQNPF